MKLPTLDCQLWVNDYKIIYEFYEKPQVANRTLQSDTALSRTSLDASLTQECVRRMINTSLEAPADSLKNALDKFARKLLNSGHEVEVIQTLLVQAATCYIEKVRRSRLDANDQEYRPLHMSKEYMRNERWLAKTMAKNNWYDKKKVFRGWRQMLPKEWKPRQLRQRRIQGIPVTSVMIVPNTFNSCLLNRLILKEAQLSKISGYQLKLVEGNGTPISKLMPAPLQSNTCSRGKRCLVCACATDKKPTRCNIRNVVYVGECIERDADGAQK